MTFPSFFRFFHFCGNSVSLSTMTSYQGLVLQGFQALREEGLLCDFTLLTEGSQFHVHKALLASVSIYFQAVFRSGMMEVQENKMEMKGVSATGLRGVLHFMYTGKLKLNQEIVMDVFRAANHLQLDSVINAQGRIQDFGKGGVRVTVKY